MGEDFSIGCSDSTCEGVSHIMFTSLKSVLQLSNNTKCFVGIEDMMYEFDESENKYISTEQLALIIQSLKNDMNLVSHRDDVKLSFTQIYKFHDDDSFERVYENCKMACDLFVDALVDSILNNEDKIYWDYS